MNLNNLPFFSLYSSRYNSMQKMWLKSNQNFSLPFALNTLFLLNILISSILFGFFYILLLDLIFSIGVFFISFASLLLLGFALPKIFADRYSLQIEQDLHLCLRSISLYISIHWPFEKIILEISKSNFACSSLFADANNSISSGAGVSESLAKCSTKTNSLLFARSIQSLIHIYQSGSGEKSLDYLCEELVQRGIANVRLQSSKTALLGLVFVAISSLLPAFFLILNVAAGPFLGFETSEFTIWFFYILLLPLTILFVLGLIFLISPPLSSSIDEKNLDSYLKEVSFLKRPIEKAKLLSQINSLEQELSTVLLAGASSQKLSVENMLIAGTKSSSALLASQCSEVLSQIKAGADPKSVLRKWGSNTPSLILSRAISLILVGYSTGASMHIALQSAAADLLSSFNLRKERWALLSMQNYTLIGACAFLVPAILSVSLSFSSQISHLSSTGGFDGLFAQNPKDLISAAQLAIPFYLILNSSLCSIFLCSTSGTRHKFLGYSLVLGFLSLFSWLIFSSIF